MAWETAVLATNNGVNWQTCVFFADGRRFGFGGGGDADARRAAASLQPETCCLV